MIIKDIKLILRDKKNFILLGLLLVSLAAAIAFGTQGVTSATVKLGVADMDDSEYSRMLVYYFENNDVFNAYISIVEASEDRLEDLFADGELDLYLVIPKDFTSNLININNIPIRAYINSSNKSKAVLYKTLLESYASYISSVEANCQTLYDIMRAEGYSMAQVDKVNYDISYELIFTALGKDDFFDIQEESRIESMSLINYYICSGLVLILLYGGLFAGLSFEVEKNSLVHQRLRSCGVGRLRPLLSKLAAFSLLFIPVMLLVMMLINRFSPMEFSPLAFVFMVIMVPVSCLMFIILGLIIPDQNSYSFVANMFILLLVICGGGIIPIMYLPQSMVKIAVFTPNYWFIRMIV